MPNVQCFILGFISGGASVVTDALLLVLQAQEVNIQSPGHTLRLVGDCLLHLERLVPRGGPPLEEVLEGFLALGMLEPGLLPGLEIDLDGLVDLVASLAPLHDVAISSSILPVTKVDHLLDNLDS